jgi:hypothetical protein
VSKIKIFCENCISKVLCGLAAAYYFSALKCEHLEGILQLLCAAAIAQLMQLIYAGVMRRGGVIGRGVSDHFSIVSLYHFKA